MGDAVSAAPAMAWDQDFFGSYFQRSDKITLDAGDAKAVNEATHVIDPWPRYVGQRKIRSNGERMAWSAERYRGNKAAPPPLGFGQGGGVSAGQAATIGAAAGAGAAAGTMAGEGKVPQKTLYGLPTHAVTCPALDRSLRHCSILSAGGAARPTRRPRPCRHSGMLGRQRLADHPVHGAGPDDGFEPQPMRDARQEGGPVERVQRCGARRTVSSSESLRLIGSRCIDAPQCFRVKRHVRLTPRRSRSARFLLGLPAAPRTRRGLVGDPQ
jgi:hypothetical protein